MTEKKNLKLDLMLLGNKLVTEHGYPPGNRAIGSSWFLNAVNKFTEALNEAPDEVLEILDELGYEWPRGSAFRGPGGKNLLREAVEKLAEFDVEEKPGATKLYKKTMTPDGVHLSDI